MSSILRSSRVAISLVPERLIAEAAHDAGITLAELEPDRAADTVTFARVDVAERVFADAIERWWQIIPFWSRIPFTMQHQTQSEWCWAATSVSVSHYYTPWSGWTQCSMVNAELGQSTCCADGATSQCNQPNVLDAPLNRARVLDHMQGGSVAYNVIRQEIDAGRPLCWRIGWSGGGGHFAVIEGYRHVGQWVAIDDPWYGQSDTALSTLTGGTYQGSGTWTHTYFTRRPAWVLWTLKDEVPRLHPDVFERVTALAPVAVKAGEPS